MDSDEQNRQGTRARCASCLFIFLQAFTYVFLFSIIAVAILLIRPDVSGILDKLSQVVRSGNKAAGELINLGAGVFVTVVILGSLATEKLLSFLKALIEVVFDTTIQDTTTRSVSKQELLWGTLGYLLLSVLFVLGLW